METPTTAWRREPVRRAPDDGETLATHTGADGAAAAKNADGDGFTDGGRGMRVRRTTEHESIAPNLTTFIDMMFILVVFFIATSRFHEAERDEAGIFDRLER